MPEDEHTLKQLWQAALDRETIGPPVTAAEMATPPKLTKDEAEALETFATWTLVDVTRRKEAGDVLSWLNANGCLAFGALPKALAAIENGDHRL